MKVCGYQRRTRGDGSIEGGGRGNKNSPDMTHGQAIDVSSHVFYPRPSPPRHHHHQKWRPAGCICRRPITRNTERSKSRLKKGQTNEHWLAVHCNPIMRHAGVRALPDVIIHYQMYLLNRPVFGSHDVWLALATEEKMCIYTARD